MRESASMNKILIVGHPASGYQEAEALLQQFGMQPAQPSKREGLFPQRIGEILSKAHGVPAIDEVVSEDQLHQIQAGSVWNGLALDLLLGNLDQPLWGWSDPKAITQLDYWAQLDAKLAFVLVYDEPHRVLIEAARARANQLADNAGLRQLLDNWVAYNGALLRFYLRHPQRCLLVHAQQVRRAADSYFRQLQPLLAVPLLRDVIDTPTPLAQREQHHETALPVAAALPEQWAVAIEAVGLDPQPFSQALTAEETERYLIDDVLAAHPAALQMYAELESAANLPHSGTPKPLERNPDVAWRALVQQRAFIADLLTQFQAEQRRHADALAQLREELQESRHREQLQLAHASQEAAEREAELADLKNRLRQSEHDNELLLNQLHQVQEELERGHLERQQLQQRGEAQAREIQRQAEQLQQREGELKLAQAQRAQAEAERDAAREQAQQRAQAVAERDKQVKELTEENELLLNQLHQVQEELERYYLENQKLKQRLPKPKPPGPYGAADRIKRQLSYRLGALMIQRSRSVVGWAGMPWALWAEVRAFRKERAARANEKLPPIHTYSDAHEAERVKKHLSYRLGSTLIELGKSPLGWLKLPFALHRQVKEYRFERAGGARK